MKSTLVAIAALAQAIAVYADGKCCTHQAVDNQAYCQANGYWASCCIQNSDANSGHGCDDTPEFPVGRQIASPAYGAGNSLQSCQSDGFWYCYT